MTTTADLALWLSDHTDSIACDEAAGDMYREIRNAVEAIERMINRPKFPKYCGNCPVIVEDKHGKRQQCAVPLYAPWDNKAKEYPVEVQCWSCRTTHNIERLIQRALSDVHDWLWTAREVLDIMAQIGEPINERTWRHWRATGKIQSRNEWSAEPKYYLEEVRALRAKTGQHAA